MSVDFPNIRHLLAFLEVARQKGVSAAAERVHLSQPAVTQAIAGLEEALGLALFERHAAGMFLTPAGELFRARVARMFDHLVTYARENGRRRTGPEAGFHTKVTAAQLRALIAVWESGNFSIAARTLGLSQPSVHRAARDLEKLAGTPFFLAGRRGIDLSPAAELFARAVKLAHAELRQGYFEISQLRGQDSTRISVGSMPLSRSQILPEALSGLFAGGGSGQVQVRTVDGPYTELLRGLRYGDLDFLIGALRDPAPAEDVIQEHLFDDSLAILAGPGHPLIGRTGMSLQDTLAYPWVAPPKNTPAGQYLFHAMGIGRMPETPVRIVSSSLVLVRGLLARGDFLTIMSPHQAALEYGLGLVVPLDVALPGSARPIGLTYRDDWTPTATQARFLGLIRAAAGKHRSAKIE
jgi:LysR family transcriptional regulator of gallate degradation